MEKTNEIYKISKITEAMFNIRSFSDFLDWFSWLETHYQVMAGIIILGLLAVVYIFIVAIFTDNEI